MEAYQGLILVKPKAIPMPSCDFVTLKQGRPVTTSLKVAEAFGKLHKNILRDIEALDCSDEFKRLNFEPTSYRDQIGRKFPAYEITRDGFTFLAMGFTGKVAAKFKEWAQSFPKWASYHTRINYLASTVTILWVDSVGLIQVAIRGQTGS